MLNARIELRVRGHKRSEVIGILDMLVERMRGAAGCCGCRMLADVDDNNRLVLLSEWSDFESASSHFDSQEFQIFRGLRLLFRGEPYIVLDEIGRRVTSAVGSR